ncbi:hypothetical protein R3P38DRAFT_3368049 [Favolaschia claudopus]|uniref:Transposase n=1 Tax=Favolaschia claudopus TaxID=2862362 RepID=A0AAW0A7P5_9AGAR
MSHKPSQAKAASKPTRTRVAPKRLVDGSNSEAPSAAHQGIVDQTQARLNAAATIAHLIKSIEDLDSVLPDSVAAGTEDDEIYRVITTVQGLDPDSIDSTFTRRFDILFKEDAQCRNADGRLHLIRRGEFGMQMVARYLRDLKWSDPDMNLAGAVLKLERVVTEMEVLSGINRSDAEKTRSSKAAASKPNPTTRKAGTAAGPSAAASSAPADAFEQLFQATLNGKNKRPDKTYKPKKVNPDLSEEEEDDIIDVDDDELPPADPKKRKIIVVDGVAQQSAPKKKKKKAKSAVAAAPPPQVDVIEVDESEDEARPSGKRGPTTDTRLHYSSPTAITLNGEKRWAFNCLHKDCQKVVTFKRTVAKNQLFTDERPAPNVGNLATHLKRHPDEPVPSKSEPGVFHNVSAGSAKIMAEYLAEGKLNPAINSTQKNFYKIMSAWIIEDDLPFTTGQTPGIQRLFAFLQTRYMLPSDTTVRNTLAELYIDMYELIKSELAEIKSKIAVATDTWSTRAMTFTFAGVIGSWITSEWELVERVLDFHPIEDKEHEGEYAALGLAKRLNELKALEKLISVSLDNASPNDVLVAALSRLLMKKFDIQFIPANSQIHCLAHVVNLVVQKILATLDAAPDPDTDAGASDEYLGNKDTPFHYDPHTDPEQVNLEKEEFTADDDRSTEEDEAAELLAGKLDEEYLDMSPLEKLRTTTTKICSSPQRRKRFRATAEKAYGDEKAPSGRPLASLMVVRDVRHRWNYTHAMIKRGLLLRKAIDTWVFEREELRGLSLRLEDWRLLEALGKLLERHMNTSFRSSRKWRAIFSRFREQVSRLSDCSRALGTFATSLEHLCDHRQFRRQCSPKCG